MLASDHAVANHSRLVRSSPFPGDGVSEPCTTRWRPPARERKQVLRQTGWLATLLVLACAPLDAVLMYGGNVTAAAGLSGLSVVAAAGALAQAMRVERVQNLDLAEADRMHALAFRKASTSIWIEDWTEVGKLILELRNRGIEPQTYFTAYPDVLPRLHQTVRITDVNDMTVNFVGAHDRNELIGK
ncbi:MAG: hypothetical protein EOP02_36465, partial [Proteobacteria bacterium]